MNIVGYSLLFVTSCLEHERSLRPSSLLSAFLGVTSLFDMARVRTLFFIFGSQELTWLVAGCFSTKIILLILELLGKRSLLLPEWQHVSPEESSGLYNRVLFLWLNPLFANGFRSTLTAKSLTPLDSAIVEASNPVALNEKWKTTPKSSRNALLWMLLLHYKWHLLAGIIPRLAYAGFIFTEPFLIERVLVFVAKPDKSDDKFDAYGLIAAYAIVYIGKATTYAHFQHKTYRLVTIFRGSLISLIYEKTIQISSAEISDAEAVTLMSADIDRIALSLQIIYDFFAGTIEVALAMWLLFRLLGVAMIAPAIWVILCLMLGIPVATAAGNAQEPWLEGIEERLAATTQLLTATTAVRFSGLSRVFSNVISGLRMAEIRASRRHRLLSILETGITYASSTIAPVWAFGVYILLARDNDTQTLKDSVGFASLSLFQLLDEPLVHILNGFEDAQTLANSINRIQSYLLSREKGAPLEIESVEGVLGAPSDDSDRVSAVETALADAEVTDNQEHSYIITMRNVSAGYTAEDMILHGLHLRIYLHRMTMVVGPVASGKSTFLRLLLGELPQVAGLLWKGFSTCAYCPQSPWISWGTIRSNIVGESIWDAGWYRTVVQACCLIADFNELPDGDQTKTGTRGSRLSGGQKVRIALARALFSRKSVMVLDDVLAGLDRATERRILDAVFRPDGLLKQLKTTVVFSTNAVSHAYFADDIVVLGEDGSIEEQGSMQAVSKSGGYVQRLMGQPTPATSRGQLELSDDTLQELELPNDEEEKRDTTSRRSGDFTVYKYFVHIAGKSTMVIYLIACSLYVFGVTFPSIWLQWWTNANALHPNQDIDYWLGIYGMLALLAIIGCMISDSVFQLVVIPKIAWKFHERLLTTTMVATTAFLTSTDAGHITNRFSQDLQLIDNDLPDALDQTVVECFNVIIAGALVFTGSGYLAAAVPFCVMAVYMIQVYYLRTSRQLRLLDIEAKAPLFSHFLETLDGVSSIRAYGWSDDYVRRNREILNASQKPYYLLWCIRRWIGLVLDLLTGGIGVLLIALATTLKQGRTGLLGVAIFNLMDFSATLQRLIGQWVHVETALGAINRIRTYVTTTKLENTEHENEAAPENWPTAGAVVFSNVSASYGNSGEPVLKNINLSISPGEKVAVCGRTGSGKSSLISSLLRMVDIDSGSIAIDDIDISATKRQSVRERVNALSQEPLLLHGSVRDNIDPLHLASDDAIANALRDVNLEAFIEAQGGVESDIGELSRGQRQLLCLARALVRTGHLLLLDEATSRCVHR